MSRRVHFVPIDLWLDGLDRHGQLVLADERLVAVVVRLDDGSHGDCRGCWNFEATFGPCDRDRWLPPVRDLDDVARVVEHRLLQYRLVDMPDTDPS